MGKKRVTVVLLLLGRYERQVRQLNQKLKEVDELRKQAKIILVADGPNWRNVPQLQMLGITQPEVTVLYAPKEKSLPAQLMNVACRELDTPYVMFSLLADTLPVRYHQFFKAIVDSENNRKALKSKNEQSKAEILPVYMVAPQVADIQEIPPTPLNAFGWCQCSRRGGGLSDFCLPTVLLDEIGAFDENPLLYTQIERWYSMAVTRYGALHVLDEQGEPPMRLSEYPLYPERRIPEDIAIRYATYCQGISAEKRTPKECAAGFATDLQGEEAAYYRKLTGIAANWRQKKYSSSYRILIVGGHWEYHHNQVCFFNYLEQLYGQGFATYRAVFEYGTPANLALGYDLVIFTRCRSDAALDMMHLCDEMNIPTLYMIDDNWLSIAKDHPEQGGIFVVGNKNYDNFIEALGLCKATWLYSNVLRKDVLPYTRCVKKFQIAVDLQAFHVERARRQTNEEIYVGFSGSLRYDDVAFEALARYARRHPKITVVLIGVLSPRQEAMFKNIRTVRMGFESYARYAKNIAQVHPDLLLAPLPDSHTSHSKCYNKYIESGAAGAVCIYSHCMPYTQVVKEGVNGYFVKDETAESWYQKLDEVLSNVKKLRRVQVNMTKDVLTHHTVQVLLESFVKKLTEIVKEEKLQDD